LNYNPKLVVLQKEIKSLPVGEKYINNAGFLPTYPEDVGLD